jgi:hypothetical protein
LGPLAQAAAALQLLRRLLLLLLAAAWIFQAALRGWALGSPWGALAALQGVGQQQQGQEAAA